MKQDTSYYEISIFKLNVFPKPDPKQDLSIPNCCILLRIVFVCGVIEQYLFGFLHKNTKM